jgi:hypothetical protein
MARRSIVKRNPIITLTHPLGGAGTSETFSDLEFSKVRLLLSVLSLVLTTTLVVLLQVNA